MAGAGPAAPPKQPASNGIDRVWRAGPFTNTPGTTHDVVVLSANRLNPGSTMASTAAHSRRIAAAGAPAITAFTAIFSTVQRPLRGGSSAMSSSGNRPDAATNSRTDASRGGISGRPSPQPASVANFWNATGSSSTSTRGDASQSISQPSGPQSTRRASSLGCVTVHSQRHHELRPVVAGDLAHLGLRTCLERIRQGVDAQACSARVRGHRVGQALELLRYDDDRRLPP